MKLQLSDIISFEYQTVSLVIALCALGTLGYIFQEKRKGNTAGGSMMAFAFMALLGLVVYGFGKNDVSIAKPYFERLEAHHEAFASEQDFWLQPELEELMTHATIDGQPFDNGTSANNKGIELLAKFFPFEGANVTDPKKLRSLRESIKGCLGASEASVYVRRLSELPVSVSEMDAVRKEVSVTYGDACQVGV